MREKRYCMLATLMLLTAMQTASFSSGDKAYARQPPLHQEKLYVHVAEEVLLTGQRLWFKAYLVKENSPARTDASKVVYVELLGAGGQQLIASKLRVSEDGIAKGEFLLPDSLSSGWYTIRAYTQWMRNFSDHAYFQKNVLVVNPFETDVEEKLTANSSAPAIFYPEGGNLVVGLDNYVVFNIGFSSQDSIIQAEVRNAQDSIITTARIASNGLGAFQFKPQAGEEYTLRSVTEASDTLVNIIPPARKQGYGMQVTRSSTNFQITVQATQMSAEDVVLLVLSQGKVVYAQALHTSDSAWSATLDSDKIAGVGRIALVTSHGSLLAERLVYAPKEAGVRVLVTPDKSTYTPGEEVNLHLKFEDHRGQPVNAFTSLAVRKVTPLDQGFTETALAAYVDLESKSNPEIESILHQWLVTQQGNPVNWKLLLSQQEQKAQYPLEDKGMLLSGTLTNHQGSPLSDRTLLFSIPGADPKFDYYRTDERGKFFFPVHNIYGTHEMILQLPQAEGYRIAIDDKYAATSPMFSSAAVPALPSEWLKKFVEKSRKTLEVNQIYSIYKNDTTASEEDQEKKDLFRFYGAPDFIRNLDDYISLPSFEEVCRELMPGIRLTKKKGAYDLDVFDSRTRNFLEGEPALIIDGVPVYDIEPLINMFPDIIDRIETVNRRTYYGEFSLNGTVAVYTKNGDEYLPFLSPDIFRQSISFYDKAGSFIDAFPEAIHPVEKRIPDFRILLFWEAAIKPDAQGEATLSFFNSDEIGTFEVIVEGVTMEGAPFTKVITYEVDLLHE